MGEAARKEPYPYIVREPEVLGETPIVEGTRIAVRAIAGYYQMGMSVDEILATLSHLTPAQVHSALAYYFDHRVEMDQGIQGSAAFAEALRQRSPSKLQQKLPEQPRDGTAD